MKHTILKTLGCAAITALTISLARPHGPLQPWFDKSWKPGDFELVK